jgi:hypothetical protein
VLGPRPGQRIVPLSFGEIDLNLTCVEEGIIEIFEGSCCLLLIFETHEAKQSAATVFCHDLGIRYRTFDLRVGFKMLKQVNFFQMLWQVLHDQS